MSLRASSSLFALAVGVAACGCGPSPSTCVTGEQIACACAAGVTSVQRCGADGTYGACACSEADASAGSDGGTPGLDGGPDPVCMDQLDLLLMVDNSNSMAEEQAALMVELPRLVRALASGDADGDGSVDFAPIASLHVGVITSDMGVGGAAVPTCSAGAGGAMFGDDGVLRTSGRTSIPGCMATYPAVLGFMAGESTDAFASDVACVASTGTGGCGFEQQLEAVLKAISPATTQPWTAPGYVPPTFFAGTSGHALGANAGFVRPGSILAAVILTDEEDCSAADAELFDPASETYSDSDLSLRCFAYPEALHPISRFASGLRALRRDARRLALSVIAGVPPGVAGETAAEYDAILALPDMAARTDPAMPTRLVPSCNVPGRGVAFPPRRIVELARDLEPSGAQTRVHSICDASLAPSIDALIESIAQASAACE
ncbi:MAG: hypothetical protein M3Y87_10495 [Myxococcota bacterium]|nr:hypothetical protein [Myxococcota bacterium]